MQVGLEKLQVGMAIFFNFITISFYTHLTFFLIARTLVQLGLCGFRHGAVKDAHNALLDIQQGGR